jgi:branched-chain amino acid transport system ATP-binding protein
MTVQGGVTANRVGATYALKVEGVHAGYGDLNVLRDVTIRVQPGMVEVVLGRNGAGKTTLMRAVCGLIPTSAGQIVLNDADLTGVPAYRRARAGLALVQEGKRIFGDLTVRDNVGLGAFGLRLRGRSLREHCDEVLEFVPMLKQFAQRRAASLSGGQQQMLVIAQALAAKPKVLLLDEPSAGLAPIILDQVFSLLSDLRSDGLTIVLVEQLAARALELADHVTVVRSGMVLSEGPPERFTSGGELEEAYLSA